MNAPLDTGSASWAPDAQAASRMDIETLDVAIIGAGFGGLGMAYYLKQAGLHAFAIFEKAQDVGGVWRENHYPGAACDAASHLYSFSFEPHYPWTCRFGKQAEILDYQRHVARKHALLPHVRFGRELTAADFDEARGCWMLRFADGSRAQARTLVSAVGQLHRPAYPKIDGLDTFRGRAFHSARWDHTYDFTGKTVAVIGTGASAVQFVPEIARQVEQLHVFQRSPGWVVNKIDRPFRRWERWLLDRLTFLHDLDRLRLFAYYEFAGSAFFGDSWLSRLALAWGRFLFRSLLKRQVKDPELQRKLTPDFPLGCKRTLLSADWLPALARPNVEVVTDAIAQVTATGIRTADGRERAVDAIVYGTGFEATQFLAPMQVTGLGGARLAERWSRGAEAYLGMSVAGFPNFFVLYGPNTNIGGGSIIYMLEAQQRYVAQCAQRLATNGPGYLDLQPAVQDAFNAWIRERNRHGAYEGGCRSWYVNAEGRNTNNWVSYMRDYARRARKPDFTHYRWVATPPPNPG